MTSSTKPRRHNTCPAMRNPLHDKKKCEKCEAFRIEGIKQRSATVDRKLQRIQQSYRLLCASHGNNKLQLFVEFDKELQSWPKNGEINIYPSLCFRFCESILKQKKIVDSSSVYVAKSLASFPGAEGFFASLGISPRQFESRVKEAELEEFLALYKNKPALIRPGLVACCALFSCFLPFARKSKVTYKSYFFPVGEQTTQLLQRVAEENKKAEDEMNDEGEDEEEEEQEEEEY